ncbi:MAG: serine hydrolase [Gammaproteobacteria bacterium]|nr:serine hydrolase [Gammaproteobacteria bacterium]
MEWGVVVRDVGSGAVLLDHQGDSVLDAASVGKLILLACAGNALLDDPALGGHRLDRRTVPPVSDSGIWQHLSVDELPVSDIARLVFICSDNLATNVLLEHFRIDRVRAFRSRLGLNHTDLLDVVRDKRRPEDPETLSRGTAAELCRFMMAVARGELAGPGLSGWLRDGLSLNVDLSMVPHPLGLDPLARARRPGDRTIPGIANKTGTDRGVRADTGIITLGSRELAYAALCNFDTDRTSEPEVLALMHAVGRAAMAA